MSEEQRPTSQGYQKNSQNPSGFLWVLAGIPLIWIGLILLDKVLPVIDPKSQNQLKTTQKAIQAFYSESHRLPYTMAELRLFTKNKNTPFTAYDRYGERLSYTVLTEKSFLLQSFGRDSSVTPRIDKQMDFVLEGVEEKGNGVQEKSLQDSLPTLYQAAFLDGLLNHQGNFKAQLFTNIQMETRTLLVHSLKNPNWVSLCRHDKVFEFLWLKSGYEIIFLAEQSERYDPGLYYWNIFTGEQKNLWPEIQKKMWPQTKDDQDFYITLSHVSFDPPLLYFVASPAFSSELNPKTFYSFQNLYAINIDHSIRLNPTVHRIPADIQYSIFDYPLHQAQWTRNLEKARKRQAAWAGLPLDGDPDSVLTSWQDFGSEFEMSSFTPYHLWWLASLYNDSYRLLLSQKRMESRVVRNFGIEMAEALERMPLAPPYLRAMAQYLKKSLLLSKPADYNVAHWNSLP